MTRVILHTDGGSRGNPGPAGAGVAILDERGAVLKTASKTLGQTTNNEAEYQALIFGLETLKKHFGKEAVRFLDIKVRLDSELLVKQLTGKYQVKEERLWPFFMKIWNTRVADFPNLTFTHVPREQNARADRLARNALKANQDGRSGAFGAGEESPSSKG